MTPQQACESPSEPRWLEFEWAEAAPWPVAAGVDQVGLDEQLETAEGWLRARLLDSSPGSRAQVVQQLESVYRIGDLRDQLASSALSMRLETRARVHESMAARAELAGPRELIAQVPVELCRACGFTRALVSYVSGSRWVPVAQETVRGVPPEMDPFRRMVELGEIPLDHHVPETEIVRRRIPGLVSVPADGRPGRADAGADGPAVSYVVAPVLSEDRVTGLLHADRYGQSRPMSDGDRDDIWAFAALFGVLFDRTVLMQRLAAQQAQLREAFNAAEGLIGELRAAGIARSEWRVSPAVRCSPQLGGQSRIEALLTKREREVMELICGGATNGRIAEQLVISEGTVKSHVKHVLRKLHADNRAEAVARYLRLVSRERQRLAR